MRAGIEARLAKLESAMPATGPRRFMFAIDPDAAEAQLAGMTAQEREGVTMLCWLPAQLPTSPEEV